MSPTVARKKAIRRSLCESGINDPFEMLADCIAQNEQLKKRSQVLAFCLASETGCLGDLGKNDSHRCAHLYTIVSHNAPPY